MITTNEAPSSGATIRYPNVRIGGLWLLVIGLTFVLATVLGGPLPLNWGIFALGFVGGMPGVWTNPISPRQRRARLLAFVFLGILLLGCFLFLGRGDPRVLVLCILLAVGLHLIPFTLLQGPLVAVVGLLCVVNAIVGLLLPNVPFLPFGLVDGLLKLGFGILMLIQRPAR